MKWKKNRNRIPFIALFLCFMFSFVIESDRIAITIFTVIGVPISVASHIMLLAKNTCPWCNQPFFFHKVEENGNNCLEDINTDKVPFFLQKKCINCRRPFDEDLDDL